MADVSDAAIRKATGRGRDHWFAILDRHPDHLDHTARVKRLHAEPDAESLSGWWMQSLVVEWEKARGHRVEGQSCAGDFQVSCSKTVPWSADECFERVVSTPWLHGADWTEGATWETDGGRVEVRRVQPGKQVRFFWFDADGKSTVVISFWPNAKGDKQQIIIGHSQLPSLEARDAYRARWKSALAHITAGA